MSRTARLMRVLITGGAGFVGSHLALQFVRNGAKVVAFDNLRRRGSELNLSRLREAGVHFHHGDIRCVEDLHELEQEFDLMIEASAEPSVHAGNSGGTRYLIDTNFGGTLNALEFCRRRRVPFMFISTSRVFSLSALRALPLQELDTRIDLVDGALGPGLSAAGIAEDFPATGHGARSLYGMTKLASEMLIEEYSEAFGLPAIINRCGVLAGPGQFGKSDQGVFTLWVARHFFGGELNYTGFGGKGKQVRDLLHPSDFFRLVQLQFKSVDSWAGHTYNVGGGKEGTVSLLEFTAMCQQEVGRAIDIKSRGETASVDIPFYSTDCRKAMDAFGWRPEIKPRAIVAEIAQWLRSETTLLKQIFAE